MLIHTAGENPNAGVHNAPIQQQQNKHWAFTPKQPQKEEFNKKKRSTWIQLSFSQCKGKAPLCGKSFSQASNLRIHFVAHRGEKDMEIFISEHTSVNSERQCTGVTFIETW